jgi:hypothetical protein
MKKFTQEELELAYKQMYQERKQDEKSAEKAAKWVKDQLSFKCNARIGSNPYDGAYRNFGPHKIEYAILLTHETYGPYKEDLVKFFDAQTWAKPGGWISGFSPTEKWYTVTTPHGEYPLTFEYWDNHVGGY